MRNPRLSLQPRPFLFGAGLTLLLLAATIGRAPDSASARRPNFVLIQADDQTAATLRAIAVDRKGKKRRVMSNTLRLIADRGVEFTNYYSSLPLCSPSRSALLSGQYAHTTGLSGNVGNNGGARGLSRSPVFSENLAVALDRAGYQTSHFGDFINHYGNEAGYDEKAVPPGWDKWATTWTPGEVRRYYGYRLNVNGRIKGPFGNPRFGRNRNKDPIGCPSVKLDCNYSTDVLTSRAVRTIKRAKRGPIYMQVDYEGPHDGPPGHINPEPARRHIGTAARSRLPRPPGFNESNIRDKPKVLRRGNRRLGPGKVAGVARRYRAQLETLRSIDDGVGRIVKALKATRRLGNTYVMVFSDHGYFLGEHRFGKSKFLPHEPASNVSLMVRGPRAKKGRKTSAIAGNVDLAPTIAELGKTKLGLEPDGRSFANVLRHPRKRRSRSVLLESYLLGSKALNEHLADRGMSGGASVSGIVPFVNYTGLRAGRYKYVRYLPGGRELYDLKADPFELSNKVRSRRYRRVVKALDAELDDRQFCTGAECRKGVRGLPKPKPKPKPKMPGR